MILRCTECGSYTLQDEHCGEETESPRPPKFSFPDNYGEYRRKTKRQMEGNEVE
ncbi:MAG: nucleolar RNA-binding Nop10p family protein [Candidatus Nanohaloarchaea archaeon]